MKQTVYIETAIVSYLTCRPSRNVVRHAHEILTQRWWKTSRSRFDLRTSIFTIDEASHGDRSAASARLE